MMTAFPCILFAGSDDFSLRILDRLRTSGVGFAGLLTQPDKPHGRQLQARPSALKEHATAAGIPVLQPPRLKDPEFHRVLDGLQVELLLVVSFGRILPQVLLDRFPKGAINLHPSLLPRYRGAAPVQRAIMNGETVSGVTIFYLEEKMDAGPIIRSREFPISSDATAGDVFDTVTEVSTPLLLEILAALSSAPRLPAVAQDDSQATLAPKISGEECEIRWARAPREIHDQVRALNPRPGAFTFFRGGRVKIWRTSLNSVPALTATSPGGIMTGGNRLFAGATASLLEILELQAEGKRKVSASEWVHGFQPRAGERFETHGSGSAA